MVLWKRRFVWRYFQGILYHLPSEDKHGYLSGNRYGKDNSPKRSHESRLRPVIYMLSRCCSFRKISQTDVWSIQGYFCYFQSLPGHQKNCQLQRIEIHSSLLSPLFYFFLASGADLFFSWLRAQYSTGIVTELSHRKKKKLPDYQ